MANIYRGFSTIGQNKKFRLTDFDLVKRDVLNHFYIRKGEKLMNPGFGTIIWNVIHEPFTEELKSLITADIKAIAGYDPRVSFDNIVVTEYDQGIQIGQCIDFTSRKITFFSRKLPVRVPKPKYMCRPPFILFFFTDNAAAYD